MTHRGSIYGGNVDWTADQPAVTDRWRAYAERSAAEYDAAAAEADGWATEWEREDAARHGITVDEVREREAASGAYTEDDPDDIRAAEEDYAEGLEHQAEAAAEVEAEEAGDTTQAYTTTDDGDTSLPAWMTEDEGDLNRRISLGDLYDRAEANVEAEHVKAELRESAAAREAGEHYRWESPGWGAYDYPAAEQGRTTEEVNAWFADAMDEHTGTYVEMSRRDKGGDALDFMAEQDRNRLGLELEPEEDEEVEAPKAPTTRTDELATVDVDADEDVDEL